MMGQLVRFRGFISGEIIALILATLGYWLLRNHPVTYDIGRHVESFALGKEDQYAVLLPKVIDIMIPRYGALSLMAPMTATVVIALLLTLGWIAFLLFVNSLCRWSRDQVGTCWFGFLLAFLFSTWGKRQTLLFANHPYEIALHFALAGFFYALSGNSFLSSALLLISGLIHPNLAFIIMLVGLLNVIRNSAIFSTLGSASVLASFYLITWVRVAS